MHTTSGWRPLVGSVVLLTAVLTLVVTAFAWPSVRSAPHGVPLVVAPPAAVAELTERLDAARPGAFDVVGVADAAAARAALARREAYGAVVLGPQGPTLLTASAASPAVAQLLGQVASGLAAGTDGAPAALPVEDVVSLPAADPRGAGLVSASLPLALGGVLTAVVLGALPGARRRVLTALLAAGCAATAMAAVLQTWLGALPGSFGEVAGVLALALSAGGMLVLGLTALLGRAGTALGAATLVLLGNPLSGAAGGPELLPAGWGTLGQLLPPGAAASALRSVAFFDGAGVGTPLAVLCAWLLLGLLLVGAAAARDRRRPLSTAGPAPGPAPVAVAA